MDDASRQALEQELREAMNSRQELDIVIAYLSRRLGVAVAEAVLPPAPSGPPASDPSVPAPGDPSTSVAVGEFIGMSGPKAAAVVLKRMGRRPLKTPDIFRAIQKGGVNNIKDPPTLWRSLVRDKKFTRVGKGLWGLSVWYPQGVPASPKPGASMDAEAAVADEPDSPAPEAPSPENVEPPDDQEVA